MIIKGIIFVYVIIAMGYYLLTVWLFTSEMVANSIVGIIPIVDGDSANDINEEINKICKNNDVLYFLFVSICGLIGGFGLPIIILTKVIKRG